MGEQSSKLLSTSVATSTEAAGVGKRPNLKLAVTRTVEALQRNYLNNTKNTEGANARRTLAELRKTGSLNFEKHPLALERVLLSLVFPLSDQESGNTDKATPSEQAVFHALTLFALHMQSAQQEVHDPERSFASACGRLYAVSDSNSIKPRFDAMQMPFDETTRVIHLRSLISLLRAKRISFDYGQFAQDLRSLQNPRRRNGVLLRWGRDFARRTFRDRVNTEKAQENNA